MTHDSRFYGWCGLLWLVPTLRWCAIHHCTCGSLTTPLEEVPHVQAAFAVGGREAVRVMWLDMPSRWKG